MLFFAMWYFGGWCLAAWVWTWEFDLKIRDAIFISVFSLFGPLIGFAWMFSYWLDHRPKKDRRPTVLIRKRGS